MSGARMSIASGITTIEDISMNTNTNEQALDKIETLLLLALEKRPAIKNNWFIDGLKECKDAIKCYKFPHRTPNKFYTFDALDNDRLFTPDYDLLISHPYDIVGNGLEVLHVSDDTGIAKWMGFFPTTKPKTGFVAIGTADQWYEMHYMHGNVNHGWVDYAKSYTAIDRKGCPLLIKPLNFGKQTLKDMKEESIQIILACSIAEDAHRKNAFRATVSDFAMAIFPIGLEGYKEFFALRDAPRNTPTGKLNPILHWVKKHIRQTKTGKVVDVSKHLKGTESVTIGGLTATLSPN